jgi:hypothetical protein
MFIGATLYFVYVSKTNLIVYAQVGAHAAHASSGATLRRLSEHIIHSVAARQEEKYKCQSRQRNRALPTMSYFDQQPTAVYAGDQASGGVQRT